MEYIDKLTLLQKYLNTFIKLYDYIEVLKIKYKKENQRNSYKYICNELLYYTDDNLFKRLLLIFSHIIDTIKIHKLIGFGCLFLCYFRDLPKGKKKNKKIVLNLCVRKFKSLNKIKNLLILELTDAMTKHSNNILPKSLSGWSKRTI